VGINWPKFKQYKERIEIKEGQTNLELIVSFLKETQGIHLYDDIYETISSDELGSSMLSKNNIADADELMKLYFKK